MTAIDLLPWRQRRRAASRRWFALGIAASVALGGAVLALVWARLDGSLTRLAEENRRLAERVAALDGRVQAAAELRRRLDETESRALEVRRLRALRGHLVEVFETLARAPVPGVRFTTLASRSGAISARGSADAESSVSGLMRNIERSARFSAPTLRNIADAAETAATSDASVLFDLTFVTVAAEAEHG